MKTCKFVWVMLLVGFLNVRLCQAQQQTPEKMTFDINYLLSLPEGYEKDTLRKWPLLIFLHGGGELGDNLERVKANGPPKMVEQGVKFPFILVSPQATIWFQWEPDVLLRLLAGLHQKLRIDRDRVYLTGLSLGGEATWKFGLKHPGIFAAIAPVCADGDTSEIWKLRNVAVWAFHGAKDDIVPPAKGKRMVEALKKYNPAARFTLYPDANHNSWDRTYANDSLYTWFLSHKRKSPVEVPMSKDQLKKYEGEYVSEEGDKLTIQLNEEGLLMPLFGDDHHLLNLGRNDFFLKEMNQVQISFRNDAKGVSGFTMYADRKIIYNKIRGKK